MLLIKQVFGSCDLLRLLGVRLDSDIYQRVVSLYPDSYVCVELT